jgi:hypothetical protein
MSSPSPSIEHGSRLASRAVELLCGGEARPSPAELRFAAHRAIDLRLAGIFRMGLRCRAEMAAGSGELAEALTRAERREVAADLAASQRAREALRALHAGGITPVVLKGRSLAERLWPRPWMRPAGDLDLLVDAPSLAQALAVLVRIGLRAREGDAPGRFRPTLTNVDLAPATGEDGVDLHTRLFRSVGSGLDTVDVASRARESELLGVSVRVLDPADEVHFLLVHAAAHGVIHPKWLLDLHSAAMVHPREVWLTAAERARASRTSRAFWAVARLLSGAETEAPRQVARGLRPPLYVRAMLGRLVCARLSAPWAMRPSFFNYALQGVLEERVRERVVRFGGMLERLGDRLKDRFERRNDRLSSAEVASHRWVERAWRAGQADPVWLTLRGGSMAPTLRDGDRLLVAPFVAGETPQAGDVVIANVAGRLVAHRLIAHTSQGVVTRGDACVRDDAPLPCEDILARVVAIDSRSIETR